MNYRLHPETETSKRGKYTELLEQLVGAISGDLMAEFGYDAENARKRAEMVMSTIQGQAGGTGIYIAKGHLWFVSEKHRRIYRRFTGANHAQLAKEFDLTERQIYSIVAAVQKEEFDRKQGKLFE